MPKPLLIDLYQQLPERMPADDIDLWAYEMRQALRTYRSEVQTRYSEGTLQRALQHQNAEMRRAAVLALSLVGTMGSNPYLAALLHDKDEDTAKMASDALWELWFRAGSVAATSELKRLLRLTESQQILAGLNELIDEEPDFAEAINQRAIVYFQRGEYKRSLDDCHRVLDLNQFHFGAIAGSGQCYLRMNKPRQALAAFQSALSVNPTLVELKEAIEHLQRLHPDSDEIN
ncbi:MAG: HEAT repeat domain-containing protein [Zavarzinella sp.]